jgi:hypothetical protein
MKGQICFKGEIITKKCKNGVGSFKNPFLQNHPANFNQTWHKSFLDEENSSFLKRRGYPFSKGR